VVLAGLLGVTIGAGLTWTGSLANLLWRRTLLAGGLHPSTARFHRVSLLLTPVALAAATAALMIG
jgi:arsenical pump membrane protein